MKSPRFLLAPALTVVVAASAATAPPVAAQANTIAYLDRLPPMVERNVFFGDPEIAFAALSPDGRFVSFVKQLDGILNVWVKGIDEPFEAGRPVSADTSRPIVNYFWSADGKYILYVQDQAGNENFRVYAVDPSAPVPDGAKTPAARDLTPFENVQARIIAVPKNSPNTILVGLNDRDPRLHDVYRLDLTAGQRQLVLQNQEAFNVAGWMADLEGNLRLGVRTTQDGGTEILRVERDSLTSVYTCSAAETCDPIQFHKDGRRIYLATNKGDYNLARLVLFDPQSGTEELVESDPEGQVDFGQAIFSNATDELIATAYTGDRVRLYPRDPQFRRDVDVIRKALPNGDLFFRVPTRDDRIWIVKEVLDTDEGPNYIYDRASGQVKLLYRPNPDIPVKRMARVQAVKYAARDGQLIPAYLTLPKGVEAKNLAVVVMPHGGPWARDVWGFNNVAQFLANRGYAVLQPNFRSSTGYGKRYLELGDKTWGTGAMQNDITDGARWLIDQGIADPKRVAIMGGSYGGYATLAGLAFTPDLYAAGVDIVGPSSIITLLKSIPPYWEPLRRIWAVRVGDLNDSSDVARLRAQSPLYSASQIKAPLLVVQGANDPRVKKAESDQMVAALRDLGRTVEYLVAPDEGHGFAGEVNNLAMYAAVEAFLAQQLGGRYQAEMRPEVKERLDLLRVDLQTVSMKQ